MQDEWKAPPKKKILKEDSDKKKSLWIVAKKKHPIWECPLMSSEARLEFKRDLTLLGGWGENNCPKCMGCSRVTSATRFLAIRPGKVLFLVGEKYLGGWIDGYLTYPETKRFCSFHGV